MEPISTPVPVIVKEWKPAPLPERNISVKTYLLDPTGATAGSVKYVQIASMEPLREDVFVNPIDASVVLCLDPPNASPDVSTSTVAPSTGAHLDSNTANVGYHVAGVDALWINSITGKPCTRVTVIKTYRRG